MRKTLLLIAFACMVSASFGQSRPAAPASSGNCFKDWYSLFKERGADPVPDGINDVIITIRNGDISDCFMGKVEVKGGVMTSPLQIQKVDGSWEEFDKRASAAYLGTDNRLKEEFRTVADGMSLSVPLADGELIRLFFYNSLRDKPKGNKRAPSPSQLVKKN